MSLPPLLLLDVDGVLNALADYDEHLAVWPQWESGRAEAAGTGRRGAPLSFTDVEDILDMHQPNSARKHQAHWSDHEGTTVGRAIRDADWKATRINLADETLMFVRQL